MEYADKNSPHILLIDDDCELQDYVRWCLQQEGYLVSFSLGVRGAIERLRNPSEFGAKGVPDLILSDYWLRDGTGVEILHAIRRLHVPPALILMSGDLVNACMATPEIQREHLLPKPFTWEECLRHVRHALGRKSERIASNYPGKHIGLQTSSGCAATIPERNNHSDLSQKPTRA